MYLHCIEACLLSSFQHQQHLSRVIKAITKIGYLKLMKNAYSKNINKLNDEGNKS